MRQKKKKKKQKTGGLLCSLPKGVGFSGGVFARIAAKACWIALKHAGSRGEGRWSVAWEPAWDQDSPRATSPAEVSENEGGGGKE